MFELINQQQKLKIDLPGLQVFCQKITEAFPAVKNKEIAVVFVSNHKIKEFNKEFRQKDAVTDVLSFPNQPDEFDRDENYLGDIVISAEKASEQALENNLSLNLELKQLILHGVLHLSGFDHETDNGEMNELELKLRDKLGIS